MEYKTVADHFAIQREPHGYISVRLATHLKKHRFSHRVVLPTEKNNPIQTTFGRPAGRLVKLQALLTKNM